MLYVDEKAVRAMKNVATDYQKDEIRKMSRC